MLLSAKIIFFLGPYTTAGRFIKPSFFNDSTSAPSAPKRLTVPSALISKLRTSSKAFKIEDSTSMFGHAIMVEII